MTDRNGPLLFVVVAGVAVALLVGGFLLLRPAVTGPGASARAPRSSPSAPDSARPAAAPPRAPLASPGDEDSPARTSIPPVSATEPAQESPTGQAARTRAGASLHGRVVHEDEPIAGARIEVARLDLFGSLRHPKRPGAGARGPEPAPPMSTTTAADGTFSLGDLPAADDYVVSIHGEGYARERRSGIQLLEDESADLGTIPLDREARVSGRVVDGAGMPVADAKVQLFAESALGRGSSLEAPGAVTTGEEGRFDIREAHEGTWRLAASKDGFLGDEIGDLDLLAGHHEKGITLRLSLGLSIEGRVVDTQGQPAGGATVSARRIRGGAMGFQIAIPGDEDEDETAPDGTFRITGLEAGRYSLTARSRGHGSVTQGNVPVPGPALDLVLEPAGTIRGHLWDAAAGIALETPAKVSLERADDTNDPGRYLRMFQDEEDLPEAAPGDQPGTFLIEGVSAGTYAVRALAEGFAPGRSDPFPVRSGESVEVRLSMDHGITLRGRAVVEGSEDPIEGATIVARERSSGETNMLVRMRGISRMLGLEDGKELGRATSDAQGWFELPHLPAKTISITGRHADRAGKPKLDLDLTGGSSPGDAILPFAVPGSIAGIVRDWTGAPRAGAHVTARGTGGQEGVEEKTLANARGAYAFSSLVPGSYRLEATERSDGRGNMFVSVMRTATGGILGGGAEDGILAEVRAGETTRLDLDLPAPTGLRGSVSEGGLPAPRVRLVLEPAGEGDPLGMSFAMPADFAVTDENGAYAFEDFGAGTWRVVSRGSGAPAFESEPIEVKAGDQVVQDLELPTAVVAGVVRDSVSRQPIPGAFVWLDRVQEETAAAQSAFRMAFTISSGAGSHAEPMAFTGSGARPLRTGKDGTFTIRRIPPGGYKLVGRAEDHGKVEGEPFELAEGARETRRVVELIPGGRIEGSVRDAAGLPAAGAFVSAWLQEETPGKTAVAVPASSAISLEDGSYRLGGLAPGAYTIRANSFGAKGETTSRVEAGRTIHLDLAMEPEAP